MGFNDAGARIEVDGPNALKKHRSRYDTALVAHQNFEEPEFSGLELNFLAGPHGPAADEIDFEIGHLEDSFFAFHRRAARESVNSREKLGKSKRFAKVVVAARIEFRRSGR